MTLKDLPVFKRDGAKWLSLLIVGLMAIGASLYSHSVAAETGNFTEFTIPTANSGPNSIIKGPDNAIWFTEGDVGKIARQASDGTITEYTIPGSFTVAGDLIVGPDGNLWFWTSNPNTNQEQYAKITPTGTITAIPTQTSSDNLSKLAVGPDGNLWFVDFTNNKVGKITPSGTASEYTIPTSGSQPKQIIAGPDGNMWFLEQGGKKIGRITTSGVITEFAIASAPPTISDLIVGPDGNLWFAEQFPAKLARVTPTGTITEYPLTDGQDNISLLTLGPNNTIWFSDGDLQRLGRITMSGTLTSYPVNVGPINDLMLGPDGNSIWFATTSDGTLGRASASGQITEFYAPAVSRPEFMAIGQDNNIYYIDRYFSKFARFDLRPVISAANSRQTTFGTRINVVGDNFVNVSSVQLGATNITQSPCPATPSNPCYTQLSETEMTIMLPTVLSSASTLQTGNDWGPGNTRAISAIATDLTAVGTLNPWYIGNGDRSPWSISKGPDGNMWVVAYNPEAILRITPQGVVTEFTTNITGTSISNLVAGPDGNMWFTKAANDMVSRIDMSGAVTDYTLPTPGTSPGEMTLGPDGAMWFTEYGTTSVGRVSSSGVITEFPLSGTDSPLSITTGPDGALWITRGGGTVTRMATNGTTSDFTIPGNETSYAIKSGPDGNLWMTAGSDKVVRMTLSGVATVFTTPTASSPYGIATGPDGNLWFNEYNANKIGRITPAGVITEFAFSGSDDYSGQIAAGPNNDLWFTTTDSIDQLVFNATPGPAPDPTPTPEPPSTPTGSTSPDTSSSKTSTDTNGGSTESTDEQTTSPVVTNLSEITDFTDGSGTEQEVVTGQEFEFVLPGSGVKYTLTVGDITSDSIKVTIKSPQSSPQFIALPPYKLLYVDVNRDHKNDITLRAVRLGQGSGRISFALYKNASDIKETNSSNTSKDAGKGSELSWVVWGIALLIILALVIFIVRRRIKRSKL